MFDSFVVPFLAVLGFWLVAGVVGLLLAVEFSRLMQPWAERQLQRDLARLDLFDWAAAEREFEDVA